MQCVSHPLRRASSRYLSFRAALPAVLTAVLIACHLACAAELSDVLPETGIDLDSYDNVPTPVPLIGILTQSDKRRGDSTSYFAASYVKYLQMAGARLVPVLCDSSEKVIKEQYSKLNGLLVPGGSQDLGPGNDFFDTMSLITDLAMQDYDENGEVFPIHYTCLGWEAAAVKFSKDPYILSTFSGADGVAAELTWTEHAKSAAALQLVPQELRQLAASGAIAYEAHTYGVWLPNFWGTELQEHFDVLSTTKGAMGKVYVSTLQAKKYPFMAFQWHPEKASFEFGSPTIPHSLPAKQLAQAIANQFVLWAQHSTHKYPDDELKQDTHFQMEAVPDPLHYFEEIYVFPYSGATGSA